MEKNCVIFAIKKLYFVNILNFFWPWTFNFEKVCTDVGLGLSFKNSGWIWIATFDSPLISAPLKQTYEIITVIELTVANKSQTRLSNPNPVKQNLLNPNPIQIRNKLENPLHLNPNPCSSLLSSASKRGC